MTQFLMETHVNFQSTPAVAQPGGIHVSSLDDVHFPDMVQHQQFATLGSHTESVQPIPVNSYMAFNTYPSYGFQTPSNMSAPQHPTQQDQAMGHNPRLTVLQNLDVRISRLQNVRRNAPYHRAAPQNSNGAAKRRKVPLPRPAISQVIPQIV
jgi:hypothetical protein